MLEEEKNKRNLQISLIFWGVFGKFFTWKMYDLREASGHVGRKKVNKSLSDLFPARRWDRQQYNIVSVP